MIGDWLIIKMVTGNQPFFFHVIGDVREFRMVIDDSGYVGDTS